MREKLPITRPGLTLHFTIIAREPPEREGEPGRVVEVDGYVRTGEYEDGRLGEFFVTVSKELAQLGPAMDEWAKCASMALQFGAPVKVLFGKHVGTRFEPSGPVKGVSAAALGLVEGQARCTSPHDLISRWLIGKYGAGDVDPATVTTCASCGGLGTARAATG